MRIEGEKGVKTQSAPNIGRGRAKEILAEQFQPGRPLRSSREGSRARPDHLLRDRNRSRGTHEPGKIQAAIGRNFRIGTDRPLRSIRETNDRPRPKSLAKTNLADQIARPRQTIGHRPKLSRPR
ncbi:unnamed protein product [Microthlaspi erraticum]|uniref:Uncharacterized protein n=1 Tax=Microthlaspi erraticum TaxID=1685480 RepID=A0A6D2JH20_9BRAS|nr:unnamed protein product [Microthlaspi erraticum]